MLAGRAAAPPSLEELRRMVAMLGHRGPDGYGLYRDDAVGLAHARLSIIDLAGGFQPLHNGDRSLWLSFNGEIFNYLELRRELAAAGHRFYTEGDSEVILHCYERYGARAWAMLNGQFAFALWDARRGRLWLVRDRLGILPLHYAVVDNHLIFASEAKALFAGGRIEARLDPQALGEIFTCWSAAAPRTLFAGVHSVLPGCALSVDRSLVVSELPYWQPSVGEVPDIGRAEAAHRLSAVLSQAVSLRLRADVPVGCYISGGLDSSVIGSMGRDLASDTLETFGIRFADPRFDETAEQQQVVRHLGTRHHDFVCDDDDIRDALEDVVWHCETPLLRTSPVPLFLLARQVRQAGIKTVLTGEGADELLAGYSIFKEDAIRRFWARQPESQRRPLLLDRIHHYVGSEEARSPLWRNFFGQGLTRTDHPFYSHLIRWSNTAWTLRLLAPEVAACFSLEAMMADAEQAMPPGWREMDDLTRAQWIEIRSFMSPYLLSCQGDRVAMASGIEARYPFLDPDVVDFCLALPRRHKLMGLRDKLALRQLAAGRLPAAVSARRKQPFRAPIAPALFGPAAAGRFDDLLDEHALDGLGWINAPAVGRLLRRVRGQEGRVGGEREEMGLVGVLTLAMWARAFGPGLAERCDKARARLEQSPPHVFENHAEDLHAYP
ncbi:MAG: asparagine synthase (glutamine-hydrolyzing) [Bacteroidota bacterium]